jgi:O-antigen ligase
MNENALSLALVAGLPFVLIAAREVRSLNYAAALTCLSIAVAGSRTGQIALVACLITYWVWRSKLTTQLKNAVMGLVCVAGLSLQVLVPIVASSGTLTNRPALWRFALNNVEESPWVGKGWNALEQLFRDNGAIAGTSAYSAHNQIIDILLVSGILGLVFFLSLLLVAIFVYPRIDSAILLLLSSSLWLGILERPWNVGYLDWLSWSAVASFAYIASAAFKRARDNQQFRRQAAQKEGELFVPTTDR